MAPLWWSALVALVSFWSLAATVRGQPPEVPPRSAPLPMHEMFARQDSGIQQPRREVIRSAAQWQSIEEALGPRRPAAPIDFGHSMVILAAMGERSTGGHAITIEGVYRGGGRLWVVVREVTPGPDCMTIQVLTSPASAVSVPRMDEPVSFIERTETRDCR